MQLTRATPDHEGQLRALDAQAFPDAAFPDDSVFWVIGGDPALGYCSAEIRPAVPSGHAVYLTRAWVCPELRRQGWQARMIRVRMAYGMALGAQAARTYTAGDNVPSFRSLIRAGFLPYETIPYRTSGPADDLDGAWILWERDLNR